MPRRPTRAQSRRAPQKELLQAHPVELSDLAERKAGSGRPPHVLAYRIRAVRSPCAAFLAQREAATPREAVGQLGCERQPVQRQQHSPRCTLSSARASPASGDGCERLRVLPTKRQRFTARYDISLPFCRFEQSAQTSRSGEKVNLHCNKERSARWRTQGVVLNLLAGRA